MGICNEKRIILARVGSNLVLESRKLNIDVRKPFRRWGDSTNNSDLRAFVRDVRTLSAEDNVELRLHVEYREATSDLDD